MYCTMTVAAGCGTILGYVPCKHGEKVEPVLELLSRIVPGPQQTNGTVYIVYDRACQVLGYLQRRKGYLGPYEWLLRPGVKWIVDRFHFAGHSESDSLCR